MVTFSSLERAELQKTQSLSQPGDVKCPCSGLTGEVRSPDGSEESLAIEAESLAIEDEHKVSMSQPHVMLKDIS